MGYTQQMSREDQRRLQALDYAVRISPDVDDAYEIVDIANAFLRFLQGTDWFPPTEEER